MSDENAASPGRHLLIAGTGRAGTSFLVRYLTELGLDTELSRRGEAADWDDAANAGLETVPLAGHAWDLPYVLKFPWTDQMIDQILDDSAIRLDTVIIPVRDLTDVAMSRSVVELQALHHALPWMTEVDQTWEMWGKSPGGVTFSLNPLDQGRLLAVGFHLLVERLIKADVPILFLAFPRLVDDWEYLFHKLRPVLPATIDEPAARDAHQRASDPAKVRIGAELAGGAESASPAMGPVIHYASHHQLDAIALRRELVRVREAAQEAVRVATEANERALKEARADAERADAEALMLRRMFASTTQALSDEKDRVAAVERDRAIVERDLAAVDRHLQIVVTSRAWRLTRPYRRFGEVVQGWRNRLRRQAVATPELTVEREIEEHAAERSARPIVRTPEQVSSPLTWTSTDNFVTKRFAFVMTVKRYDGRSSDGVVTLLKVRPLIEAYCALLNELAPKRVLELGFFQGGMPLLIADLAAPEKIVGIDYSNPSEELKAMIERAGLSETVKLYGTIGQTDIFAISQIIDGEFQGQPIDLIIDDASHEYETSKASFEGLFGYLRPGGKYVIEDWGWLHWPGEAWQTAKSHFWNKPAMTNLIFEIIMTLGSRGTATIARIEVISAACVVVTRGKDLEHGEKLDLAATRLTSGRVYQPL